MGAAKSKRRDGDLRLVQPAVNNAGANHAPWVKPVTNERATGVMATTATSNSKIDTKSLFAYYIFALRQLVDTTRTLLPDEIIVAIVKLVLIHSPANLDYFEVRCQLGVTLRRMHLLKVIDFFLIL